MSPEGIKVLLTGKDGQLGRALQQNAPEGIELVPVGRDELDLADPTACREAVRRLRPDWVLNAGAYTAVDKAEDEPELALAVNAGAPEAFAAALDEIGGRLLQVSTDFVFDGQQGHPYRPEQPTRPLGVYGRTKAEGERRVLTTLPPERLCVLRTSWVYGPVGRNFCLTMLRLHRLKAEAGESLGVVADQVGCPTATHTLAEACWAVVRLGVSGIQHWSDAGAASWYDFAITIGQLGVSRGLLKSSASVRPIGTGDYLTPARRPSYSLLDCTETRSALDLKPSHWRAALDEVMEQVTTTME
jgi:dTDP-4-dehydrorhamnose reductase